MQEQVSTDYADFNLRNLWILATKVIDLPRQTWLVKENDYSNSVFLWRRLPVGEHVTRVHNARRIDCYVSLVDVSNNAFFIDHEGCAISKALLLVKDAIILHHGAFEVAEYRKGNAELLGKFAVG